MKLGSTTVKSISDPTGLLAPLCGADGVLGRVALLSQVVSVSGGLNSKIIGVSGSVVTVNNSLTTQIARISTLESLPYFTSITSSSNYILDFSTKETISYITALAADITFSTANVTGGKVYGIRIKDTGTTKTLTFPGSWQWLSTAPTTTTANKWVIITLESYGNSDSNILADWKVQS